MTEHIRSETTRAAQYFMSKLREGQFVTDALDTVINATISTDDTKAQLGTHVFFNYIVETLSDTFLIKDRKNLEMVLAHLVSRLRVLPKAEAFHRKLSQWGLNSEAELLARIERHPQDKKFESSILGTIKKIYIPSRVTLGADVLLNTLVIERMKTQFPEAEIILLGSEKNGTILKGDQARVRVLPLHYNRRGDLVERFLNWLEIVRVLEEDISELMPGEDYFMINTDSRLLQSGLLPVFPPEMEYSRYFCWLPSIQPDTWNGNSQADDLRLWLANVFGERSEGESLFPCLHLQNDDTGFADNVFKLLTPELSKYTITMSFGVGGNQGKRIKNGAEPVSLFEINLIIKLLALGVNIILDKGFGREESEQVEAILHAVQRQGYSTTEVSEENIARAGIEKIKNLRLIVFQGSINKFAALISRSSGYIGYDSLGQHLAAAMGKDVITIFAGYQSPVFPARWQPMGRGNIRLIKAQNGPFSTHRQDELVDEVIHLFSEIQNY